MSDQMDRIHRLSSIGRPIDPAFPTNKAIAALSLALLALGFLVALLGGSKPPAALVQGLVLAAGFFLAWAIAREVDPDHPASAFVAAALSLLPLWLLGRPAFVDLFLVLLSLRIVNRTVGPPAKTGDTLLILAVAAFAAWNGHTAVAIMAFAAFLVDGLMDPPHRPHLAAAGAALALAGVSATRMGGVELSGPDVVAWVGLALAAPVLLLIRRSGAPRSTADLDARPLSGRRLRTAQLLALGLVAAVLLTEGKAGLAAVSSVWAALAGTGLYQLYDRTR